LLSQAKEVSHLILARKAFFSSGVRYARPSWSEEKNREVFGAHSHPHGHGFNYVLEVRVEGERDPVSGLVVNLTDVDRILSEVVKQLDRRHLAYDVPALAEQIPTLENIAQFCFTELKQQLGSLLAGIRLRQGEDDWVDLVAPE
jgi:6-pyruvoyltetrahydropterin/6-carboxytetrahydropterin synthase